VNGRAFEKVWIGLAYSFAESNDFNGLIGEIQIFLWPFSEISKAYGGKIEKNRRLSLLSRERLPSRAACSPIFACHSRASGNPDFA
jgi:hypothetical protein